MQYFSILNLRCSKKATFNVEGGFLFKKTYTYGLVLMVRVRFRREAKLLDVTTST
jgi:hypothetical protein